MYSEEQLYEHLGKIYYLSTYPVIRERNRRTLYVQSWRLIARRIGYYKVIQRVPPFEDGRAVSSFSLLYLKWLGMNFNFT